MNNMINDLDGQVADEFFYGTDGYRTAQPVSLSKELQLVDENVTPVSMLTTTSQPKPRTTTTTTTEPKPRTVSSPTETGGSIPRPLPPVEEIKEETIEESSDMPIFGGGGGGGGAARMSEEGSEEEGVMPIAPKKILGLDPMTFYIGLGLLGLGTFIYFKKIKNKK